MIAFDPNSLRLESFQELQLDDLANPLPSYGQGQGGDNFRRANVALMAKFSLISEADKKFAIMCSHLYWNPNKPKVKLTQTRFVLDSMAQFRGNLPGVIAGDFNALPDSDQYRLVTEKGVDDYSYIWNWGENERPRFLCDASLSRICRWLRLLGFNTALETKEQLQMRSTSRDFSFFFGQARTENRLIITSSKSMVERAACPEAYIVETKDMMGALVDICMHYRIPISEEQLLTVCGDILLI